EAVRQMMFADDDFDVHAEIVGVAEDLDHASGGRLAAVAIVEQLDVHHHAIELLDAACSAPSNADAVHSRTGRRNFHTLGDVDPLLDALVLRLHVAAAPADVELADDGGMGTPQHLDHVPVGASIGFDACDTDHHAIAMHRLLRFLGRQENVTLDAFDRPLG